MAQQGVEPRSSRRQWTERQKQVLDLVAARYTNGEIAEKLGFSFAAAKWHVSELITILGVDTREEVAAYWRAERGIRGRVMRPLRALAALGAWKVAAGTAGIAVIAGGVVAGVTAIGSVGGPAAGSPTRMTTPSPETATPAPTPLIGEVLPDFDVASLTDPSVRIQPPGGKPFVMAFVASWCRPCAPTVATLEALQVQTGVEVVLVDSEDAALPGGWLSDAANDLPIASDATGELSNAYHVLAGLPATYFVDSDRRLQAYDLGALTPGTDLMGNNLSDAMASIGVTYNPSRTATASPP